MNILNIKHSLSLLMFFLLLFSGCATKVDRLEYALEFAGENRRELEKVLEYYSDDSLKFRAAMGHRTKRILRVGRKRHQTY